MERNLKVLIVGARYMVGGKFSTLLYNREEDYYRFASPFNKTLPQQRFHEIDHTPGLGNPIFDLNQIPLLIEDYTLEEGDWCKDFPVYVASGLLKAGRDLQFTDKTYEAKKNNLIFLFSGKTLASNKNIEFAPELKTEYYFVEFGERYRNLLLIEQAENFL